MFDKRVISAAGGACPAERDFADVYMCRVRKINQSESQFDFEPCSNLVFCVVLKKPALQVNLEVRVNF